MTPQPRPRPWADGPWKLIETPSKQRDITEHAAYFIANLMACAHNCMIRGLNALWLQSPNVTAREDATALLFFAHAWARWVLNHFELEEGISFPGYLAVEGAASRSTLPQEPQRREAFKSDMQAFSDYCSSTTGSEYDAARFCALIRAFADPFADHLHKEIPALLALDAVDGKEGAKLLAVLDETEKEAATQDKFVVPPMVMGLRDKTFEGGNNWPPLPFGVESLINYVLAWKHQRAWRFLPCDHWGMPRDLAFGPES